ncbi:non-ribosomal peptide synthetase [Catenuloplanes japonicus]|uniref:non-ribosomal peptide synthetase n=1 Tax=Catenuloplanes japonicus TaxID=33876 RepID=UPI0005246EE3|nr:non-ribosomal peptide synthetase [Catenuloplanes japonicus]
MSNDDGGRRLPLTGAQLGVWYALRLHPGTTAYDIGGYAEIRGPLDPDLLEGACAAVVREAGSLRARFDAHDDQVTQTIVPDLAPPTARVDLRAAPDPVAAARAWLASSFSVPRDPLRDPLVEFTLLRLGPDLHWWCPRAHHLVLDGYSMPLVCARIADVYRARSRDLPDGDSPFRPYQLLLDADAAYRASPDRLSDKAFWESLPPDGGAVPTLSGRGPQPPGTFHRSSLAVPFADPAGVSWGEAALAAFAAYVSRLTGSAQVSLGIPFASRSGPVLRVPGNAANVLPLRLSVPRGTSASELSAQTAAALASARRHQRYRGEDLAVPYGPSVNLKYFDYRLDFGTATAELRSVAAGPVDDLTLSVRRAAGTLHLDLDANAAAYSIADTERALRGFGSFLATFEGPLEKIDFGGTGSARAAGGQAVGRALSPEHPHAGAAFAAQAARTPEAVALRDGSRSWTFRALADAVDRLALRLRAARADAALRLSTEAAVIADSPQFSVAQADAASAPTPHQRGHDRARQSGSAALAMGPEPLIALALPRGAEFVIAMLAVARSGMAWLPLDLTQPADRLDFMLRDAAPLAALVPDSSSPPIAFPQGTLVIGATESAGTSPRRGHDGTEATPAGPEKHLPAAAADARLAYAIYTSGSTGRPKAVQVSQGALASLLAGHRDGLMARVPSGRRLRIAHTAPLSFDAALDPLLWMVAGHELILVPEDVYRDPAALVRLVREQRIDYVDTTPSHLALLLDAGLCEAPHRPCVLVFGGEAAPAALWTRLRALTDQPISINAYGPTEYTVDALHASVDGTDRPVLGGPVAGARALVLDDALRPVPEGGVGELYLGGPGLARGYASRPGLTATRFVADRSGSRLFRTGDRVRLRFGGEIEFLGRADDQVKIRGFRVEPGEVETVLAGHPRVAHAIVVPRESPGGTVLAAYVVPRADDHGTRLIPEVERYLRERLPDYLVPAAVTPLDALPMTTNGKLDLRALPAPALTTAGREPESPVEKALAGIFAELLGVERIGVDDDFFTHGGHSLTAARLLGLVRSRLGAEIDLRAVFAGRTVAALARTVEEARRTARPVLTGGSAGARTPLSAAQTRFWFADRLDGGSALYNIPLVITLDGRTDPEVLRAALRDVTARHDTLRTVVSEDADGPWQRVLDDPGDPLTVRETGPIAEPLIDQAVREPFDLAHRAPLRAVLLRGPETDTLVLTLHHLAGDQAATGVLLADLATAYAARAGSVPPTSSGITDVRADGGPLTSSGVFAARADDESVASSGVLAARAENWTTASQPEHAGGRGLGLPRPAVTYRDYTRWHTALLAHVEDGVTIAERQRDFWRRTLDGLPAETPLARDRPRPAAPVTTGAVHRVTLGPDVHTGLRDLARAQGVTTFTALHAATAIVLDAFGAGEDLAVGTPIATRPDPALDAVVGCFLNTVVLRTDLSGDPTVRTLLDRVQTADAAAFAHADLPFERVIEALNPPREPGRHPLFQIMIIHEYAQDETLRLDDVSGRARLADTGTAKFDLTVKFTESPDGVDLRLEYATALFDADRIEAIAQSLLTVLSGLTDHPDSRLSRLSVLPGTAWEAGRGPAAIVPDTTLPALFTAAVTRHPDRTAVVDDATGRRLSYAELDAAAARVATGLRARGAGPGTIVAVEIPRSVELIIALYAIHRSGAAYLPLDPDHPAERTALMRADADPVTHLDAATVRELDAGAGTETGRAATPGDPAYVIYTSGSTGRPKGVVVPHRAIVNRLLWMQDTYPLGADDVVLQKTPAGFDVSVWEFFWPLLAGATLVLAAPGGHRDPGYLAGTITRHRVTTLHFVPSMLGAFLTDPRARECDGVRRVFCSGEALPAGLVARFRAALPAELHNLYGPTEAAVDVTAWRTGEADTRAAAPIGRPVWNTGAHVLDRHLRPAPAGVPGELYLSGVQLATGYLGRAGLTATRFVAHPQSPGRRLYRTGDLARRRPDGAVDYLGRTDDQVKIRGVRIELGEVEAALLRHPSVRASAAATRTDRAGNARLLGFVVASDGAVPDPAEIRTWLGGVVPEALIPSTIRVIESLPLTPSGKLDRRALPTDPQHAGAHSVPPSPGPDAGVPPTAGAVPGTGAAAGAAGVPGIVSIPGADAASGAGAALGIATVRGSGAALQAGAVPGIATAPGVGAAPGAEAVPGIVTVSGVGAAPGAGAAPGIVTVSGPGAAPEIGTVPGMSVSSGANGEDADVVTSGVERAASPVAVMCRVFAEVLERADADPDTGFFAAGGDSILAIQLVNRARAAGWRIQVKDVFSHQSPAALARVAQPLIVKTMPKPSVTEAVAEGPVELTPIMHRLRERGGLTGAVQTSAATVPAGTDRAALTRAVETLLDRHPMLRARLTISAHGHWSLLIPRRDEAVPATELIGSSAATLDPREGRNSCWRLVPAVDGGSARVIATIHHLAVDTVSWAVLWADLHAALTGTALPAVESLPFRAWSARLRELASSPAVLDEYDYWLHTVSGPTPILSAAPATASAASAPAASAPAASAPAVAASADAALGDAAPADSGLGIAAPSIAVLGSAVSGNAVPNNAALGSAALGNAAPDGTAVRETSVASGPASLAVGAERAGPLWRWAVEEHRFTGEDLVLAAVALAVRALRGSDERQHVTVAVERHGRGEETGTVGWFTTLFPVRLDLAPGAGAIAVLKAVKETLRAVPNDGVGYGLLRYLNPQTAPALAAAGEPELLVNYLGHVTQEPELQDSHEGTELVAYTVDTEEGRELRAVVIGVGEGFRDALGDAFTALSLGSANARGGRTPADLTLKGLSQRDVDVLDAEEPGWQDVLPVGPLQEGLVALAHTAGTRLDVYTVQLRLRFRSPLDVARMRAAIEALFARHAGLRLGLRPLESGRVAAVLHGSTRAELREHDASEHDASERGVSEHDASESGVVERGAIERDASERGASAHGGTARGIGEPDAVEHAHGEHSIGDRGDDVAARRRIERFDLRRPPLFRFDLVAGTTLIITGHHAAWDGWSAPILVRDLLDLYIGRTPEPDGSRAHLAYLRELAARDPRADLSAWRTLLNGLDGPTLLLPDAAGVLPPEAASAEEVLPSELRATLPESLGDALRRRAGARGLTLNTMLQGAWGLLLARRTGRPDTTFGITVSGRPPEIDGLDRAIGLFVNTVPARCEIRPGDTLGDLLARLQDRQAATAAHHGTGLAAVQRAAGLGTLFDTLLVFENYPLDESALLGPAGGGEAGLIAIEADDATHYPVTLTVFPGDEIGLSLGYRPGLLGADAAGGLLAELRALLELFAAGLSAPVTDAALPDTHATERQREPENAAADGTEVLPEPYAHVPTWPGVLAGPTHSSSVPRREPAGTARLSDQSGTAAGHRPPGLDGGRSQAVAEPDAVTDRGRPAAPHPVSEARDPADRSDSQPDHAAALLAEIFADILEIPHAGADDSFLALGGDSILAIQLVARARAAGLHLTAADVFAHRTASALARVATMQRGPSARPARDAFTGAALTPIMYWLRDLGSPAVTTYSQHMLLTLPPDATEARLRPVIQRVLDRHPMLRARLTPDWRLEARPPGAVRAEDVLTTDGAFDLDPHRGDCTRWVLRPDNTLLVVAHHLVVDGVSWRVLMADLATAWQGTPLPAPGAGFDDWTSLLTADAATRGAELPHWRRALDAPEPFPGLRLDPEKDTAATRHELTVSLGSAETESLLSYGAEEMLLAGLVRALGDAPVSILLEGHGRNDDVIDADVSRTVGWFTSMYPVRLDGGDPARIAATLKGVPAHGLGYGQLRYLRREITAPEPQIRFNYLGRFTAGGRRDFAPADRTEPIGGHVDPALPIPYPLDVTVSAVDAALHLRLAWPARHLDEPRMRRLADDYLRALRDLSGLRAPDPDDAILVDIDADELDDLWRNQ